MWIARAFLKMFAYRATCAEHKYKCQSRNDPKQILNNGNIIATARDILFVSYESFLKKTSKSTDNGWMAARSLDDGAINKTTTPNSLWHSVSVYVFFVAATLPFYFYFSFTIVKFVFIAPSNLSDTTYNNKNKNFEEIKTKSWSERNAK